MRDVSILLMVFACIAAWYLKGYREGKIEGFRDGVTSTIAEVDRQADKLHSR